MIYLRRRALILLTVLLCQSCALPDPTDTDMVPSSPNRRWKPGVISSLPLAEAQCLSIPDQSKSLKVMELIDTGLRNNPATQISWENALAAAYQLRINQSTLYPAAVVNETVQLQRNSVGAGVVANANNNLAQDQDPNNPNQGLGNGATAGTRPIYLQAINHQLTLTWLLLDFGGRSANIESAKQALLSFNWTHNRTIQNVVVSVLTTYYNYQNALANYAAQKSNLEDSRRNLESAERLFEAGVRTKLDVLQAQSNYVNSQLQLETFYGQIYTTHGQLANAMGIPANVEFKVEDIPEQLFEDRISKSVEELMTIAKQERPDLAAAYANYLSRQAQVVVAKSSGLPTLNARADGQRINFFHDSIYNGSILTYSLNVNFPLYQGYYFKNLVKNARELALSAYDTYKQLENNVYLDVVVSYYDVKTALQNMKYSDEFLKYSQEAYDAGLANYREGVTTITDLLQVQTSLANARAQRIRARTQFVTALANLAYATGAL